MVTRHPGLDDAKNEMGCLPPPEPQQPLALGVDGSRWWLRGFSNQFAPFFCSFMAAPLPFFTYLD